MSFESTIPVWGSFHRNRWSDHPERMLPPGRNEVFRIALNPSLNSGTELLAADGTGLIGGDPVVRIPGSPYDACDRVSRIRHNSNRLILNFAPVDPDAGDCQVREWWPEVWARSELFIISQNSAIDCNEEPEFASADDAVVQSTTPGGAFLNINFPSAHAVDDLLDDAFNRQRLVMVLAARGTISKREHRVSESVSMLDLAPAGKRLQGGFITAEVDEPQQANEAVTNAKIETSIAGGPFVPVKDMITSVPFALSAIGQIPYAANGRVRVRSNCAEPLRVRITG